MKKLKYGWYFVHQLQKVGNEVENEIKKALKDYAGEHYVFTEETDPHTLLNDFSCPIMIAHKDASKLETDIFYVTGIYVADDKLTFEGIWNFPNSNEDDEDCHSIIHIENIENSINELAYLYNNLIEDMAKDKKI
jgi:hypothetical protein